MDQNDIRLGNISACIAGDLRYSTMITVWFNTVTRVATIDRAESCPRGGMDGGTVVMWHLSDSVTYGEKLTATRNELANLIVKAVKFLIAAEMGGTVKRYGTPQKNFVWTSRHDDRYVKGLSVKNCLLALQGL
jgi:hypothetical protein